ncbi:hypothetical protein F5X68DRAFT_236331 [Plectosphaerella plurivora]|uniref:DUF7907 domain-containing protein n=1 Tax=Plectosphaerella plurivora TaxID=936078 RepID=A0A9P9A6B2_9PEZI|nr:hypothetical protein F5X68DRAFT_236331 [Plectosphaerella plurivora]
MQIRAAFIYSGLASLAAAYPIQPPKQCSHQSKGFTLEVRPKDFGNKLVKPGESVTSLHIGAGRAIAGVSDKNPRIWYLNGTDDSLHGKTYSFLTDGGSPSFPSGFSIGPSEDHLSNVTINAGDGTEFTFATASKQPTAFDITLALGVYAVCEVAIPYYRGKSFKVLKYINPPVEEQDDLPKFEIPEGCVQVILLPQCAGLPELPENAIASHEHAVTVGCDKDVESRQ